MDSRFFKKRPSITFHEVLTLLEQADLLSSTHRLNEADFPREFVSMKALQEAESQDLSFFHSSKYLNELSATQAGAVLVPMELREHMASSPTYIPTIDVHRALALLGQAFLIEPEIVGSIDPTAVVHEDARVSDRAQIGPHVFVGAGAEIGAGTVLQSGVSVGPGVIVGEDCRLDANVSLSHAILGDRVHLKPNSCVGQRGFGWAISPNGHVAKPQVGRVLIGSDVEIGAATCVDRGSVEDTVIGDGTVIDNLCQIGHNCKIGKYCVLVAKVSLGGSTTLGDFVVMAGGAGSVGHLSVGSGAQIRAWTMIGKNLEAGEVLAGNPGRSPQGYQRLLRHWSRIARGKKSS